jgi:AcrR family transcriptional regulator
LEGQRRGIERERVILNAVIELLGELGYEAMTMDAVAARAHASKTTIYRRWQDKPEMVRAAVEAYVGRRAIEFADSASLREDLMVVMRSMRERLTHEFVALMSGLVHAMRRDRGLAKVMWKEFVDEDPIAHVIIRRAVARGEVAQNCEAQLAALTHEVIEGQLFRQMMLDRLLEESFAAHVVDDLVLPVLAERLRKAD